jgi:hypothetical protein
MKGLANRAVRNSLLLLQSDRIHEAGEARIIEPRSAKTADDFLICRKAARCLLREGKPAVHPDFKDAPARSLQADLCGGLRLEDQFPRRTGARLVASQAAVFDFDFHQIEPFEFLKARTLAKAAYRTNSFVREHRLSYRCGMLGQDRRIVLNYPSSVFASARASTTSAAFKGVIGSRCGTTKPMV